MPQNWRWIAILRRYFSSINMHHSDCQLFAIHYNGDKRVWMPKSRKKENLTLNLHLWRCSATLRSSSPARTLIEVSRGMTIECIQDLTYGIQNKENVRRSRCHSECANRRENTKVSYKPNNHVPSGSRLETAMKRVTRPHRTRRGFCRICPFLSSLAPTCSFHTAKSMQHKDALAKWQVIRWEETDVPIKLG